MSDIAIIGAGPAGLKAAEILLSAGHTVTLYDQKPTPARKFLMAGRGGLNITHSEPFDIFMTRYGRAAEFLRPALEAFSPEDMRNWCTDHGEETFIGSSGRVFPRSFKASPLLRAWMIRLGNMGLRTAFSHCWEGWELGGRLSFETPDGAIKVKHDAILLALGGASWPKLGSDAKWIPLLEQFGITIHTFRPSNCGFHCAWSSIFLQKSAGQPLKNIALTHLGKTIPCEVMITEKGIEGGGIYALSAQLRDDIARYGKTTLYIDLKPTLEESRLEQLLSVPRGRETISHFLHSRSNLSTIAINLLNEDRGVGSLNPRALAERIKHYPLNLTTPFAIDRAISSAGGVALDEISADYMLKKRPGVFVAGEMIDWEAPTGGYLLQASFATGAMAAKGIIKYLST